MYGETRVQFALALVSPEKGPATRYTEAIRLIREKFDVARSTAAGDIDKAYKLVQERINKTMPTLAARTLDRLESLSIAAETAGDHAAAVNAHRALGKWAGLDAAVEDRSKPSTLSDAALDAMIAKEIETRIDALPVEQLEALVAKRRGAEHPPSDVAEPTVRFPDEGSE